MNEFKFQLLSVVLIILLGSGVYWAFSHLELGVPNQQDRVLVKDDTDTSDTDPLAVVDTIDEVELPNEIENDPLPSDEKKLSETEQSLVEALQRLIDDNIFMKKGSYGTRVGTVQKFLNYYFETNKSVDNDYGPGTMADVKKFQEAEDLAADGLAGPNTYRAMIKVLQS